MRISAVPLDSPDDAFRIVCSCQEFDQPDLPALPREAFLAAIDNPWPGLTYERYLAKAGDTPVGYLVLGLPQHDNHTLVEVDLVVLPEHRRRGVGRKLLDLAVERTRALGRQHLIGSSVQIRPDGAAFAEAAGAGAALQQLRCRLDLSQVDQGRLDTLLADAWKHASGYEVVRWVGVPPDDVIDDVAAVANRLNTDSPTGDLPLEPQQFDADQIRRAEEANVTRGRETFNTGVRRDGRLVGWTAIAGLLAEPRRGWQQITLVLPEDRGHRLGMVLKLENLRFVRGERPLMRYIDTLNALSNEHMLSINRQIGFLPAESIIQWRLSV